MGGLLRGNSYVTARDQAGVRWRYPADMPTSATRPQTLRRRVRRLTLALLVVWAMVSFGTGIWAHALAFQVWGWPFHFWLAAQGSVLLFLALIVVHATLVNRWEAQAAACEDRPDAAGP